MCEIPSNVILADQFVEIFDGFSIGANGLTQLALGLDRDSSLVSHIYDERNEAVKRLVKHVIDVAKEKRKKIGICAQTPSDFPWFAEFLVECGIDSIHKPRTGYRHQDVADNCKKRRRIGYISC